MNIQNEIWDITQRRKDAKGERGEEADSGTAGEGGGTPLMVCEQGERVNIQNEIGDRDLGRVEESGGRRGAEGRPMERLSNREKRRRRKAQRKRERKGIDTADDVPIGEVLESLMPNSVAMLREHYRSRNWEDARRTGEEAKSQKEEFGDDG